MKYILFSFILISFSFGQEYDSDNQVDAEFNRPEKIDNIIIWRLTEDLGLSPQQAEKFFPRFREHRKRLDEFSKNERQIFTDVRLKIRDEEELSKSLDKKKNQWLHWF